MTDPREAVRFLLDSVPGDQPVPVPRAWLRALVEAPAQPLRASPGGEADSPAPLRLLTASEVAERLQVKPRVVFGRARSAEWAPFTRRLGRKQLRFDAEGFERWLARQGTPRRRSA